MVREYPMRILILEDNADRRTAMLEHIADCLPMFGVSFFETSDSMIQALQAAIWDEIALISLDNDLDPVLRDGKWLDIWSARILPRVHEPHRHR
jgi:hypothetical protein